MLPSPDRVNNSATKIYASSYYTTFRICSDFRKMKKYHLKQSKLNFWTKVDQSSWKYKVTLREIVKTIFFVREIVKTLFFVREIVKIEKNVREIVKRHPPGEASYMITTLLQKCERMPKRWRRIHHLLILKRHSLRFGQNLDIFIVMSSKSLFLLIFCCQYYKKYACKIFFSNFENWLRYGTCYIRPDIETSDKNIFLSEFNASRL